MINGGVNLEDVVNGPHIKAKDEAKNISSSKKNSRLSCKFKIDSESSPLTSEKEKPF